MKKLILLLFCFICLSGCTNTSGTVSRDEYESIVAEVDNLKSQIESIQNDKEDINIEVLDSSTNGDNSELLSSDEETSKERVWLRDFTYEYDENNIIFISLYVEGERLYVNGHGIYEEGNIGLLQYDRRYLCSFLNLLAGEGDSIDMLFTVGEDEYLLVYVEGELVSDTVPMDNVDVARLPDKYSNKRDALNKFMDFIHNE